MELAIYRSFSFAYPLFASLKMSGLSIIHSGYWHPPSPDIIPPQSYTQNLHSIPSHPTKGIPIMKLQRWQNQQKRVGIIFSKKMMKRRKVPLSQKSCKTWSSNKKTKFLSKCESISFLSPGYFIFHKIGIWLSSNPSGIPIRLGNTGNQGMQHSSYPWTPHISLRSRKKRVKTPTPCEDHTPWVTWEYHWGTWTPFEKSCKTPS